MQKINRKTLERKVCCGPNGYCSISLLHIILLVTVRSVLINRTSSDRRFVRKINK
jgi:hypothetical protein